MSSWEIKIHGHDEDCVDLDFHAKHSYINEDGIIRFPVSFSSTYTYSCSLYKIG